MALIYKKAEKIQDFKSIHEYTTAAFSDVDFKWTVDDIQKEVKAGWELWSVINEEKSIIAAVFFRLEGNTLLTKNSGPNIHHQGLGHSHEIKNYFEKLARQKGAKRILHYCRIDDFRAYSLNEGHGYIKLGKEEIFKKAPKEIQEGIQEDGAVVIWEKNLK